MKHQKALIGFKKARSHIEKIIEMIEKESYCIDIMQQNLAVIGLLRSAHQKLLESHLSHCFTEGMKSKDEEKIEKLTEEILKVTKLFNK